MRLTEARSGGSARMRLEPSPSDWLSFEVHANGAGCQKLALLLTCAPLGTHGAEPRRGKDTRATTGLSLGLAVGFKVIQFC